MIDLFTLSLAVAVMLLVIILVWLYLSKLDLQKHIEEISNDHATLQSNYDGLQQRLAQSDRQLIGLRQLEIDNAKLAETANQFSDLQQKCDNQQEQIRQLTGDNSTLRTRVDERDQRLGERDAIEQRFRETFEALSAKVLHTQGKTFRDNADSSLRERQEAIAKIVEPLEEKVRDLNKVCIENKTINNNLLLGVKALSSALSKPTARGNLGEIQLERILELSGLQKGINYTLQDSVEHEGNHYRTDVIVRIDDQRKIILDSKVSLVALQEAYSTEQKEEREQAFERHLRHVNNHIDSLAKKEYQNVIKTTIDAVIMVMPEFAFTHAYNSDYQFVDRALKKKVIVVTPPSLLVLLKAINMTWQQVESIKTVTQVRELGKEICERLTKFAGHFVGLSSSLAKTVKSHNEAVASWDSRLASSAQKFKELHVSVTKDVPEVRQVEQQPTQIQKLQDGENND